MFSLSLDVVTLLYLVASVCFIQARSEEHTSELQSQR